METAYADGFDVGNMSLGGGSHGIQDLLTIGVDTDQANMVFAVAAGNSGPGTSPWSRRAPPRALSLRGPARCRTSSVRGDGRRSCFRSGVGRVRDTDNRSDQPPGRSDLGNVSEHGLHGVGRGLAQREDCAHLSRTCTFSTKIRNAQAAGAAAVLVVNNVAGDPIAMGQDGTPNQPTAAAYMVSLADRATLVGSNGASTTISATLPTSARSNGDIMAGVQQPGPTDVDFRVKPDAVAPGVNVLSSIPAKVLRGTALLCVLPSTSMATPHPRRLSRGGPPAASDLVAATVLRRSSTLLIKTP